LARHDMELLLKTAAPDNADGALRNQFDRQ
jgi:hypothetical protein